MLEITEKLRPNSKIPPYPNYHNGDYFEEFFFKKFTEQYFDVLNDIIYIPIFWTNCYTNKVFGGSIYDIQEALDKLDKNKKYFIVTQHDDCVYEKLPPKTIIFSMGGNKRDKNVIPIPLICSPIPKVKKSKKNQISFVGSLTHPLRNMIYQQYRKDEDFIFHIKNWELKSENKHIEQFINLTAESMYTLCPRGYGATSFRLYESMQLDSVPVYIFDKPWLPWEDELDWTKLSILIDTTNISNIKEKIINSDYESMLNYKNEIFDDYFTYDGVYNNIIKKLNYGNFKF
jgi:hypothetical protein